MTNYKAMKRVFSKSLIWRSALLVLLLFGLYLYSHQKKPPSLTKLSFINLEGNRVNLKKSTKGYMIYYLDPMKDCISCISDLSNWEKYREIYKNITYASVQRRDYRDFKRYESFLKQNKFEGQKLIDIGEMIASKYNISDGPCVLIFNEMEELVSILRFDDFDPKAKGRFFHRILAKLNS